MHGVAPRMCGQDGRPLLGRGAGGRSPGYLPAERLAGRFGLQTYAGRSGGVPTDGRGAEARPAAPVRSAGVGDCDRPAFPCRINVGDLRQWRNNPRMTLILRLMNKHARLMGWGDHWGPDDYVILDHDGR
jgi:hypothetical protein